jgi:XTP/dITP diphosphohydrolase
VAMSRVVLASGNKKKLQEMQRILSPKGIELIPQTEFSIPEAIEDGFSFVENALIKARHASKLTGLPAIADDSGIEVDFLQGAPGIYSARFAKLFTDDISKGNSNDEDNNNLLLEKLAGIPEARRTARYQCCIVMMRHAQDAMPLISQGHWEGRILTERIGCGGFGYDPIFYVPTHHCSAAELSSAIKNSLSHRALALQDLLKRWPKKF